mmetsp:Transcript_2335/g.4832  ORF Transcript_2335/g.4832 Transcript_2335/m.4832 type:complete len:186 (-) Transcript_2335:118-675(-)
MQTDKNEITDGQRPSVPSSTTCSHLSPIIELTSNANRRDRSRRNARDLARNASPSLITERNPRCEHKKQAVILFCTLSVLDIAGRNSDFSFIPCLKRYNDSEESRAQLSNRVRADAGNDEDEKRMRHAEVSRDNETDRQAFMEQLQTASHSNFGHVTSRSPDFIWTIASEKESIQVRIGVEIKSR